MRHKLTLLLACACVFTTLVGATSLHADPGEEPEPPTTSTSDEQPAPPGLDAAYAHRVIAHYRREVWSWQRVMGRAQTRSLASLPVDPAARIAAWRRLALRTRHRAQNPPHKVAWLCIQRYEAAWHDPNAPYYGGLQMDLGFQRIYGSALLRRKGTADHWTPLEQMWTAERAHRSGRGFYPWPNTARYCGLI
jgi:hypothetical protein